jgi:hypothetical protein
MNENFNFQGSLNLASGGQYETVSCETAVCEKAERRVDKKQR